MIYGLEFTDTFRKQFSKLDKFIQQRITTALERIRIRPEYFVKRLVGSHYHRLRVGDYRIILDIKQDKLVIVVIELGHRRNIYK